MADNPIQESDPQNESPFVTWTDDTGMQSAFAESARAMNAAHAVQRASAGAIRRFEGIDTNISVRDGFTRRDYEYFRPEDTIPLIQRDIIQLCMSAYRKVGIVRQVIDLMGDFGSQGIRIVHPDPETQKIYRTWFKKVSGKERSERILNMLYRAGNVVIKRNTARFKDLDLKTNKRVIAKPDHKPKEFPLLPDGEIPWKYFIPNPITVEIVGDELSVFTNYKQVGLKLSPKLIQKIKNPQNPYETSMVASIPTDVRNNILSDNFIGPHKILPIDPNKVVVLHYKRDDWQIWADPMIYCILDDLIAFEKLKLADLCALDGAINRVRLWKVGSLEHRIMPTEAAIQKLNEIILAAPGNGVIDLFWNPAIELVETSTDVAQFLGSEKYKETKSSIYQGLGVPQTLRGEGDKGGMSDNFVQMKTMMERLQYGRDQLTSFWDGELNLLRKALAGTPGFQSKTPPKVIYNYMNLGDSASYNALIRDMVDRDIISIETARDMLDMDNELEDMRLKRERARRKDEPKVSPYHDAQPDLTLEKVFAQTGTIVPSQVGLKLDDKNPAEQSAMEFKIKNTKTKVKSKKGKSGTGGDGRPKNSKDKSPRKQRTPLKASENIAIFSWGRKTQEAIAELTQPLFLKRFGKENVRKFSDAQAAEFEEFKFAVLCNIAPLSRVDTELIVDAIKTPFHNYKIVKSVYNEYVTELLSHNEAPSLDDYRQLQILSYVGSLS
jgi:hypothetical protein